MLEFLIALSTMLCRILQRWKVNTVGRTARATLSGALNDAYRYETPWKRRLGYVYALAQVYKSSRPFQSLYFDCVVCSHLKLKPFEQKWSSGVNRRSNMKT